MSESSTTNPKYELVYYCTEQGSLQHQVVSGPEDHFKCPSCSVKLHLATYLTLKIPNKPKKDSFHELRSNSEMGVQED